MTRPKILQALDDTVFKYSRHHNPVSPADHKYLTVQEIHIHPNDWEKIKDSPEVNLIFTFNKKGYVGLYHGTEIYSDLNKEGYVTKVVIGEFVVELLTDNERNIKDII